jgi:two-component sensor histidine kinase
LSVTRNPTAEKPDWVNYSTDSGLASDAVWAVAESDDGKIYPGTGRGLDQLDLLTGRIRHLTSDFVNYCMKDSQGNIWVVGSASLSKIDPRSLKEEPSPPTYFSRVQSGGDLIPLPETGAQRIPFKELPFNSNLSIDYLALSFQGEHPLKYQYKLDPLDKDWSAPSGQRSVNYARLAPGSYQFMVRSINEEGVISPESATFEFRILAPIWQRWWFLALVFGFLLAGGLTLHRFRLRQFMAMEKIRRQVATDLHDDVGSGLAQVAILSEVAKREASPDGQKLMNEVADLARSMRESMGDIVWAVDPRHDKLTDLVARMRQAAYNLIEANGLRVDWHIIEAGELARINLGPDVRRHLLLIFKETLTNVARHAQATEVRVEILAGGRNLQLTVKDNGRGFDQNLTSSGQGRGLQGLRERAHELGATLSIESPAGAGTVVTLNLPLK